MINVTVLTERNLGGLTIETVVERLRYINALFYGPPGVGKTVLAGSADAVPEMRPVLFIDVEGGTMSLRNFYPEVDVVRVQTWQDMQKVYDALYDGDHGYSTVVLDSLTEIQKFSMYNIMRALVRKEPDRDPDIPGMREWGKNIEQIRALVRAFRDLPVHTIFTALVAIDKDSKTGISQARPSLSGKLSAEVGGFVDIVGYTYTKVIEGQIERFILTQGTDRQIAKDRSGRLPQVIESPTMEKIYTYAMTDQVEASTDEGEE